MTEKKKKLNKKFSIEELYQNKNFVPPKEKNLETIFEEPRKAKDGAPILTSVRKYKRYLHFDPTEGKIHKRKLKAKKCVSKIKTGKLRTRSSKKVECEDISMYILEAIGETSDSEMEETTDAKDEIMVTRSETNDNREDTTQPSDIDNCRTLQSNELKLDEIPDSNREKIKHSNSEKTSEDVSSDFKPEKVGIESTSTEEVCDAVPKDMETKDTSRSSCIVA